MHGRHDIIAAEIKTYSATKPQKTWTELFSATAFWLFPPTFLWGLTKVCVNKMIGKSLRKTIFPAYGMFSLKVMAPELRKEYVKEIRETDCQLEKCWVQTHDNAMLDTIELKWCRRQKDDEDSASNLDLDDSIPETIKANPNERVHVINFLDNNKCCEQILHQMEDDVEELGANVIAFNYRGVGLSTGDLRSKDDLVIDGIAQVQRLLSRGVDPEKIILKGHGFGAAIATLVAKHMHDREKKVNLFNSRSFSTLTNLMVGQIRSNNRSGHRETWGGKILGWMAKPFLKIKLCAANWEIEADSAYLSLPETYKEYMLVRSRKRLRTPDRLDDPVVTHYASLHAALKPQRQQAKQNLNLVKQQILVATGGTGLVHKQLQQSMNAVNEARARLCDRKMEPESDDINGHSIDADELISQHSGKNGNRFFQKFVDRVLNHHGSKPARKTVHFDLS